MITAFVSDNGGAIRFEPSLTPSFEYHILSDRVESIFGGDFSIFPIFFEPGYDVMIIGGQYELNNHPLLVLSNISSVVFEDIYVNQTNTLQEYKCVIIKGNFESNYWTKDNATQEANSLFTSDIEYAFLKSQTVNEEIRERYAEPELLALAHNIQYKLVNDTSYTPSQFALDYKNLEYIATTKYHLTNPTGYLNELLKFVDMQTNGILPLITPEPTATPTPQKTIFNRPVNDPYNLWYVGLLGVLPLADFLAFIIIDYYRKKRSKLLKWFFLLPPAVTAGIFFDMIYNYPKDYQLFSLQTILLLVLWSLPFIFYEYRKKLSGRFIFNKKDTQTKNQTNNETDKSINSKEKSNNNTQ